MNNPIQDHNYRVAHSDSWNGPPYICQVGEHEFITGRIPDEFSLSVTGGPINSEMLLIEKFEESQAASLEREKQLQQDASKFKKLSIEYDGRFSVVTVVSQGTRKEISEALFREIIVQGKFFLGDERADAIYDDIVVEVETT